MAELNKLHSKPEQSGAEVATSGRPQGFTKARRAAFLARLAETANVSASARTAGVTTAIAYRERRRCAEFRAAWGEALGEGYVRLESEILAEALRRPDGRTPDATLKARAARTRLAMSLLTLHRAAVRGGLREAVAHPVASTPVRSPADIRKRLEARFAEMRARMADDGE